MWVRTFPAAELVLYKGQRGRNLPPKRIRMVHLETPAGPRGLRKKGAQVTYHTAEPHYHKVHPVAANAKGLV